MSNLSQFIGGSHPPQTLVNGFSDGLWLIPIPRSPAKGIPSGALTAGTLKTVLSITGPGAVNYLAINKIDATSRTVRLKVTIDGIAVFDVTSAANTTANNGLIAVGSVVDTTWLQLGEVTFNASLLVEIASSLSETDKLNIFTIYETR